MDFRFVWQSSKRQDTLLPAIYGYGHYTDVGH